MTVTPQTPFRATGNTDRASFRAQLALSITFQPSPVAVEADAIYDVLAPLGLTRLGAAMAWIERRNETDPGGLQYYGRELHNLWAVKNPPAEQATKGEWRRYPSYAAAAADWGPYILGPVYRDLTSIAQLIGRYAPWSDGNNPDAYGRQAAELINGLPLLDEEEPPVSDTWQPVIYNLRNDADAARFGLSRWQADTIINKCYPGRNGLRPEVIVCHVQDGWTKGSLTHWLNVQASSTVMVQQDGSILKIIAEADGPWTNGDVNRPAQHAQRAMDRFGRDLNPVALTIEAEDGGTRTINAAQRKTILWLCRDWMTRYSWITVPDDLLGHYQINSVDKSGCGLYRDDIAHALADGETPTTPAPEFPNLPVWLPADYLRVAFPLADPKGVVTRKVIQVATELEKVPLFIEKVDVGNNRNIWRFEDFTLLNDGSKVWQEGKAA